MKRLLAMIPLLGILLSGCSLFQWRNYISVEPHQEQSMESQSDFVNVSSYSELEEAIVTFVEEGTEQAMIAVPNYDATVLESHLRNVLRDVLTYNPIGAYAVNEIEFDLGTNSGQAAILLQIDYLHDHAEIRQIRKAGNTQMACNLIKTSLDNCDASIVVRIAEYEALDFTQMVEDYVDAYPEKIMERPEVSVSIYPDNGLNDQIVELKFTYQTSRDSLRNMQKQVKNIFDSAVLYVSGNAEDRQKFAQLYSFLTERYDYEFETSITPAYSLLRHGVGDSKAFAVTYSAMCRLSGLDCQVVSGTRDGGAWYWNIIRNEDRYYHVDLIACMSGSGFQELTDNEMDGYVWDFSAFPECVDENVEEPTLPADQEEPTATPED